MTKGKISIKNSFLLILLMLGLLFSCNARKSEVEIKKTEEKKDLTISVSGNLESNVKVTKVTTENKNITTFVNTAEPIDPTKPSHYTDFSGQKRSLSNTKYTEVQTFNSTNMEVKKDSTDLSKSEQNAKFEDQGQLVSKSKSKNVDKKEYGIYNLLWLLIPIGLYLLYKKYIKKSAS
jgi:hypothetical protein